MSQVAIVLAALLIVGGFIIAAIVLKRDADTAPESPNRLLIDSRDNPRCSQCGDVVMLYPFGGRSTLCDPPVCRKDGTYIRPHRCNEPLAPYELVDEPQYVLPTPSRN